MAEELDRNDPDLKYLSVERNQFNDPATQAEWTQKRLVWVPHENQRKSNDEQRLGKFVKKFLLYEPAMEF
uniref:Myosin N-terminal SH3-like domain-containing protein n=1 Tax=Glossina palpalis gambiensis TaxID=67801 RepID=A0A1B0ALH5_9MUSC